MRVSIIIPLYNKSRWICRALNSIARQTFNDFELLVVDDGSTDGGATNLRNYDDPRFRLITQLNAGPGAARNRGVAEAKGELLAFLDADDEWLPSYLEDSIRLLADLGEGVASVSSGVLEYPSGLSQEPMWRARGITEGPFRLSPDTRPIEAVHRLAYMHPCTTVVRADIFRRWGGFYSRDRCVYGEDSYLWLKILLNERIGFHVDSLTRIHYEAGALSKNLNAARPVEPLLSHSTEIESVCPSHLRNLLPRMLAIRAFKTTCMLGYWGRWREARSLREQFSIPGRWKLPYYVSAKICSTVFGATLGQLWRTLMSIRVGLR